MTRYFRRLGPKKTSNLLTIEAKTSPVPCGDKGVNGGERNKGTFTLQLTKLPIRKK